MMSTPRILFFIYCSAFIEEYCLYPHTFVAYPLPDPIIQETDEIIRNSFNPGSHESNPQH
jgi:hypothetical protein